MKWVDLLLELFRQELILIVQITVLGSQNIFVKAKKFIKKYVRNVKMKENKFNCHCSVAYKRGFKDGKEKCEQIVRDAIDKLACDEDARCVDDDMETYISTLDLKKELFGDKE